MIDPDQPRVLVLGPRSGLLLALENQNIPYAVWSNEPRKRTRQWEFNVVAPFTSDPEGIESNLAANTKHINFTHVIAGTESAVLPASVARRVVGARQSSDTVILRCRDKLRMKEFLRPLGIPMTPFLSGAAMMDSHATVKQLGYPVVVKDRTNSGGRGIQYIQDEESLARHKSDDNIFERFVDAPEFSVESFIDNYQIRFTNVTEYYVKRHVNIIPAELTSQDHKNILALNEKVIRSLNINWGVSHLEVFLRPESVLFGEIALRPPGGYIMDLMSMAYGFNAWDAFLAVELGRDFKYPERAKQAVAAMVLHPGSGIVKSIEGQDYVENMDRVLRLRVKARVGQKINWRAGAGEDVGHVLLRGKSRDEILGAISEVQAYLKIIVE